ncbi:MAG: nitrite reductase [Flavobacteriaceae bacterium]
MQSFRTELENPVVEKDIIELENKIQLHKEGKIPEERFRSLRLARGVYGQRQHGVQMIRIKIPYGRVTSKQLIRIASVADEYSTGKLHITTRQDIQIHYVSLDRTPELWSELEKDSVTLREACGNTVRNVTASADAGISPNEPFDVTPYADAVFKFFLRNPVCEEMGRKFKISFSSNDNDSALSYIHDLGFIPKVVNEKKGFKVLLAGGLGSQPREADVLYDFLEVNQLIPVIESVLRVFNHYGERTKRLKARMKFLIKSIGLEAFKNLIAEEQLALSHKTYDIDTEAFQHIKSPLKHNISAVKIKNQSLFKAWKRSNVFVQKQQGYCAVGIKVRLGDFSTDQARALAHLIEQYAADELRFTLRQNILVRHVKLEWLAFFYSSLKAIGLADVGYESTSDITACPGTDTCNLGIASSTGMANALESVIENEYPEYLNNKLITIKISGCMNACGQHNMSQIGFQGMSIKTKDNRIAPAVQILLGGSNLGNGSGKFADKVIKLPSKRGPEALRILLDDYDQNSINEELFTDYYERQGKGYFYNLLTVLSDVEQLQSSDFIDWGNEHKYIQAVGVGECAGVVVDLVSTLILEATEKIQSSNEALLSGLYADAIYHAYTAFVNGAKAILTSESISANSQAKVIALFDEHFIDTNIILWDNDFPVDVYSYKQREASYKFAKFYITRAEKFLDTIQSFRNSKLNNGN